MRNSVKFFREHKVQVEKNILLLEDNKSKEVYAKMIEFRCTYNLKCHPGYTLNDAYFVCDIICLSSNEVFCDGGAFDGDTVDSFFTYTKKFKKIVCLEPDPMNFAILKDKYGDQSNIILYNKGLWNHSGNLRFNAESNAGSYIVLDNDNEKKAKIISIPVVAIDELEDCREVTYIKMDIEGAEMKALMGAKNTILRNHPKLAICIYHSDEDMIQIMNWIHDLVPDYKMYIRQHSHSFMDTVLYCL